MGPPALLGIPQHLMQKEFSKSCEGFLRAALTGNSPSYIYSCSIGHIWEHEFCHLGCWAVKGKFLKDGISAQVCNFLGCFFLVFMVKTFFLHCSILTKKLLFKQYASTKIPFFKVWFFGKNELCIKRGTYI